MGNPFALLGSESSGSGSDDSSEDEGRGRGAAEAPAAAVAPAPAAGRPRSKVEKKKARRAQKRAHESAFGSAPTAARKLGPKGAAGISGRVSAAFENGHWSDALVLLETMHQLGKVPKLGALQRWVAGLGDGATSNPNALRLLDAVLRVATGLGVALGSGAASEVELRHSSGGFGIKLDDNGMLTNCRGPAAKAGLRVGTKIAAVNGQPVQGKQAILAAVNQHKDTEHGGRVRLSVVAAPAGVAPAAPASPVQTARLHRMASWAPTPPSGEVEVSRVLATLHGSAEGVAAAYADVAKADAYRAHFSVISHQRGCDRTPPNSFDLKIYMPKPSWAPLRQRPEASVQRYEVPGLPGAFVLSNVLSAGECRQILAASEAVGYVPDQPATRSAPLAAATAAGLDDRAANFTLFASDTLLSSLATRVAPLLPQTLGGADGSASGATTKGFAGLNARWRFYRYSPGAVYRPHIDGAWPASALRRVGDGGDTGTPPAAQEEELQQYEYVYDGYGDRRSRLTFLLYLNDDFEGGDTTFFMPADKVGVVEARGVSPRAGSVLCFPHGDGAGSLVHEGSAVSVGSKYIARTDVLYFT